MYRFFEFGFSHHSRQFLALICASLVIVTPFFGPRPAAAATPDSPGARGRQMSFRSQSLPVAVKARNGFKAVQQIGRFRAGYQEANGGLASIESPWGEAMNIRHWATSDLFVVDFGEGTSVAYTFDRYGRPEGMFVEASGETTLSYVGNLQNRLVRGQIDWTAPELAAHLALSRALTSRYSTAFLEGLGSFSDGTQVAPAGCTTQGLACAIALLSYLARWVGVGVCATSVPATEGATTLIAVGCISWILGHLAVSASVMLTCTNYMLCENGQEPVPEQEPTAPIDETPPFPSPIILDLTGNGYHLSGPNPPVFFDLDADGVPEPLSWTSTSEPDAFLCLDDNQNGVIDNGAELFGNYTILSTGERAENGFEALSEFDLPEFGGNGDGKISAADWVYSMLRVWTDANRDGVSQASERQDLASAGVVSIDCDYTESGKHDAYGNEFQFKGKAKILNSAGRVRSKKIYDVFFVHP